MPSPFRFYSAFENLQSPKHASATLDGSFSHRASIFCQPFLVANSFGWHVYPPVDIDLCWSGETVNWRAAESERWNLLDAHSDLGVFAQLSAQAPEELKRFLNIPLLAVGPEAGIVQIWSGLFISSDENWCALVRPLVNTVSKQPFRVVEGMIDSDWWLGPLVFPVQVLKTDHIIRIRRDEAILQLQPVHRSCIADAVIDESPTEFGLSGWTPIQWEKFKSSMELRVKSQKPGAYRNVSRIRQRAFQARGDNNK